MKVVFISSRKGGCGKSTITANLACHFASLGYKVAVMDLDPQQTLAYWASMRQPKWPHFVSCQHQDWLMESSELEDEGIELLFIDSPPVEKKWVQKLMTQVELIIIPTRPSPMDVYSATFSNSWAKRANRPTRWVINAAHPNSTMPATIRDSLSDIAQVFDTVLHQRTEVAVSLGNGQSVSEFNPGGKSAIEFEQLAQEVAKLIHLGKPKNK